MIKIVAVCDEEQGCPLYRRENRLDFASPIVSGAEGVPICSIAVESLQKAVTRIQAGETSTNFARTFCGGLVRLLGFDKWLCMRDDGPLWFRGYDQWSEEEGYPKLERLYCCRGCADGGACSCLEAGPAA